MLTKLLRVRHLAQAIIHNHTQKLHTTNARPDNVVITRQNIQEAKSVLLPVVAQPHPLRVEEQLLQAEELPDQHRVHAPV
jgi:hypothetical protein